MIVIAIVPLLIALGGLILYLVSSNPKATEIGRLMFFAGLLALCLAFARHVVTVGT